jgi:diacylglycerol kinase (ATP)
MKDGPIRKKTGFRHFLAAASYSAGGARRLIGEAAFRQEVGAFLATLVVFALLGAGAMHYAAMILLFLLMMAFEAINTAIEEIVDRLSPEISDMAKHAKDLGSFACFCMILANGGWAAYVVISLIFF